jgi:hypothetical protein
MHPVYTPVVTTLKEHLSSIGRRGGEARAKRLSPEQRSASARKAVRARWGKILDKAEGKTDARENKAAAKKVRQ